ncbi:hypothetical protein FBT96_10050 [Rhodobacter capsulatus]|uniref:Calcium-binding protein n=1 Tax=Rhodobacter capsulatus TaxID=1061 RepID=A0A4U1JQM4_RHOCA|nr:calcium-binding protein [Rhodobacter capsulatus]TKD18430.1 hypothetical protein FBT96_10050 [Rhodobacter capsulatus]
MRIAFTRRVESGFSLLDTNIERLEIVATASGTFLYSVTGSNGGILAWRIGAGAVPSVADSFYFPGSLAGMAALDLSWATFNGYTRIIFGVTQGGDLLSSNSDASGDLGRQTTIRLNDAHSPWLQNGLLTAEIASGADMIYVSDAISGVLNGYAIDADGIPRWVSGTASPSGGTVGGQVLLEMVAVAGQEFLLRADCGFDGVASYRVGANGALVQVGTLGASNGLGVNDPTVMTTIAAFGKTFVLLGAGGSGTISVMELTATGSLRPTDHLMDTLDSRFGTITALEAIAVRGRVFVVAGGGDDGLTLFTLLPDGRLVQLQTLEDGTGLGLQDITTVAMTLVGTELQIFVASGAQSGLSLLRIDLAALGVTVNGAPSGSLRRDGSALDDLLVANTSGGDTLMGLAGEDVLVSGPGSTVMFGGAGNDTFVIRSSVNRQYVMDYSPGDRIDLSGLPMLRSTAQLIATPTDRGLLLSFGGTEIEIVSATGRPLALSDIWAGLSFGLPDRLLMLGELQGERIVAGSGGGALSGTIGRDTLIGSSRADTIRGLESSDMIQGGGGNDVIFGDSGNDTIAGNDGDDSLVGGEGANRMNGGNGNDTLTGGEDIDVLNGATGDDSLVGDGGADRLLGDIGRDTLLGGAGNDNLNGGGDDDRLSGGEGNDFLGGGAGNDTLLGDAGDDTLRGDAGNDRIEGGAGVNLLSGGAGADTLLGGSGNDSLYGGMETGTPEDLADSLSGGGGDDALWGGAGADTLRGDSGNDTLRGGSGADLLDGGDGDDWLFGESGNDLLTGGLGKDVFLHDGSAGAGTDWISDYGADDRLVFTRAGAQIGEFGLRWVNLGGDAAVRDVQLIHRPTGAAVWTVVDAESLQRLTIQIGGETHYLLV